MISESEEAEAMLLGRNAQHSFVSAVRHTHSTNEDEQTQRLRETDAQRIAVNHQVIDARETEEAMARYQDYALLEEVGDIPLYGISIENAETIHDTEVAHLPRHASQPGVSESSPPRESHSGEDEECSNALPESEIQEMAMFQWHMQQVEGNNGEDHHMQYPVPAARGVDNNPDNADQSSVQNAWQRLLSGQGSSRTPSLNHATTMDNDCWGDECEDKVGDHLRLYVQNVNGLRLDQRGGQFDSICQVQKEVQADIWLGQEHNLDSSQYSVRSILHNTHRQHWQRARLNIATTPIAFKKTYKPGGTFMLTVGNATGRIKTQDQDKWGRWVSQTLQGTAGRQVTIISAYQPVTDAHKPGTVTVATQQHTLLVQQGDPLRSPREAFIRDLKTFLVQRREMGER